MDAIAIHVPLLNPNEPEALVRQVYVQEGQWVTQGEPICTLETTKITVEVETPGEGYIAGIRFAEGQTVQAGEILCYLAQSAGWKPTENQTPTPEHSLVEIPEGLRITRPALELAQSHHVDLRNLPSDRLITLSMVQALLPSIEPTQTGAFDPTAIIVYGGGGHGKTLIELLKSLGCYRIVGIVDDGIQPGTGILGYPVLGGREALENLHSQGVRLAVNAVGGIGNTQVRMQVFQRLAEAGFVCPAVVHPRAYVEASARLSGGVQVMAHAYVGSEATVGYGCLINTGAIISHDCTLGDYVNISPGAILAGGVQVGRGSLVGMGVTVNLQVAIGAGARIGNSATVKADVPDNGVVRAGSIWPE